MMPVSQHLYAANFLGVFLLGIVDETHYPVRAVFRSAQSIERFQTLPGGPQNDNSGAAVGLGDPAMIPEPELHKKTDTREQAAQQAKINQRQQRRIGAYSMKQIKCQQQQASQADGSGHAVEAARSDQLHT